MELETEGRMTNGKSEMKRMANAVTYAEHAVNPGVALAPKGGFVLRRKKSMYY